MRVVIEPCSACGRTYSEDAFNALRIAIQAGGTFGDQAGLLGDITRRDCSCGVGQVTRTRHYTDDQVPEENSQR